MTRVALVGPRDDPQIQEIGRHVRALEGTAFVLDFSTVEQGAPLILSDSGKQLSGLSLDAVGAAYVRHVPGPWPPVGMRDDGEAVVLGKWMGPFMQAREREQAALGVLLGWHARRVRMLNPPAASGFAQNKPFQLESAKNLRIPIPSTLITNDPKAARAFIREHGKVIAKPVHGGALTVALSSRKAPNLDRIKSAPVILQERIDGADVRLMMLGKRALSCRAIELDEGNVLDFRASEQYQAGHARYAEVKLPADLRRHAAAWMKACGLVFAGIDLKLDARGKFTFLEMNSSPIYLDQERKTGDGISRALAEWLTQRT